MPVAPTASRAASRASSIDAQEELAMDAAGELLAALRQLVEIADAKVDKGDRSRSRSSKRTVQRPQAKQLPRHLLTA